VIELGFECKFVEVKKGDNFVLLFFLVFSVAVNFRRKIANALHYALNHIKVRIICTLKNWVLIVACLLLTSHHDKIAIKLQKVTHYLTVYNLIQSTNKLNMAFLY
jgi:hypothetical protein